MSCLAFSRDAGMLAVGERGHQPSATVWSLATGTVVRELAGGHRFGIGCVAFTPSGGGVVTMGFKHDRMLRVRAAVRMVPGEGKGTNAFFTLPSEVDWVEGRGGLLGDFVAVHALFSLV